MLKITWFVLKIVKKWFWAFLNFDTRARRDAHADMDCQYVIPWPEIYVYWIWSIYDEWLWNEMKWNEMKWNLLVHIPQITKDFMAYYKKNHMFVEGSTEKRSL